MKAVFFFQLTNNQANSINYDTFGLFHSCLGLNI